MIKCPNCAALNLDGTLLCEGCAWDLMDEPSIPEPAAAPVALSASGFDVMPFAGPGASGAPLVSTLRPPTAAQAPMAELMPDDLNPAGMTAPIASPVTVLAPSARVTGLAPTDDMPTPAQPMTGVRPPVAFEPTKVRPPTSMQPPRVSVLQRPQPPEPPRPQAPRVSSLAPELRPKLVVVRGGRVNAEYLVYDGDNYIGRSDESPVDIDLCDQEPKEKTFASRQHACVTWDNGTMYITDLNSANGTYINKTRMEPHEKRPVRNGDYVQTGSVMFVVRTY